MIDCLCSLSVTNLVDSSRDSILLKCFALRGIVFIDTWNTLNVLFNAIYTIISYKILCCNERLLIVKKYAQKNFPEHNFR
nr:MAG TPA: hypothetical protein [Caudoviricetes sp.]